MPDTEIEPAPIVSVPENDTTAAPVAGGQIDAIDPGGAACSPAIGCEHTVTRAFESAIALAVPVAAFRVSDGVHATIAQLVRLRYEPAIRIKPAPIDRFPEN